MAFCFNTRREIERHQKQKGHISQKYQSEEIERYTNWVNLIPGTHRADPNVWLTGNALQEGVF